ncbi:MAG: orotate phosphoribosyltransferase [Clostridiaceae bacterium]|jgi:orotate phosphoribosyltransferase|nr:orotate phosphoribosyltransferase [Clostridiaceae bacterium]
METRSRVIQSQRQPLVNMTITPGHFATRNSHINYYVDLTSIKSNHVMAKLAAEELAATETGTIPVDTIVCLDGTEVVAAFLAETISAKELRGINRHGAIVVLTPEINTSGQLMFRDNYQKMINHKNILLLVAQATTGITITQAIECIDYYRGRTIGIHALFSAIDRIRGMSINSIFPRDYVADYSTYQPVECPSCKAKHKIDALVNSYGYSKI